MFFGVGGTGKSWLLNWLRQQLAAESTLPSAYVDFDRKAGGTSYVTDFSDLLAEVWRQLDVECPRFETAYAWIRSKQGAGNRPLVRHSGKVSTGWDLVKEVTSASFSWVPGINLLVWGTDKLGRRCRRSDRKNLAGQVLADSGRERGLSPSESDDRAGDLSDAHWTPR